jgi:hypothetical protein
MMKVPKAGRPLAKCPHPKGTCSCQKTYAFMVRIPKGRGTLHVTGSIDKMIDIFSGSSCLCRPLYKVPAGTSDSSQSTPVSMVSVSSPSSGKVQKPGRRQSNIQATPESIAKALEAMPENLKFEDGTFNHLGNFPSHQSEQDDFKDTSADQAASVPQRSTSATNGSSCCSQKPQPAPIPPTASQGSGSCCSGKTRVPNSVFEGASNAQGSKVNQPTSWNDMSYMNFSAQQMPSWQNTMTATQQSFMPPFGVSNSGAPPFYTNEYTGNGSSTYSNSMNGLGITPPNMTPFTMDHSQSSAYGSINLGKSPSHDCSCGDDCQCLGCAAHPFNNTTRQHVQEMGVMMTFDGDDSTTDSMANAYNPPSFPRNTATYPMNSFMQQTQSMNHGMNKNSFEPYSDPNSAMPSGYSSPLPAGHHFNQQLMHPSEYYTIEYPVGIPSACSDVTGSCQCGNDCSCVGCLTHSGHNGVALDAPISETPVTSTAQNAPSSHGVPTTTAGSNTPRISALENVSMPCLSPRTFETSMI